MSKRFEYSFNGIVVFDDVQRNVSNGEGFSGILIGRIHDWLFSLSIKEDRSEIYPLIIYRKNRNVLIHCWFNIFKKDGSSAFTEKTERNRSFWCSGQDMNAQEILDDKNGYLNDDGELSIEYGMQLESFQGEDGIWKFNFFDPVFNCQKLGNMISFMEENEEESKFLHCHRQLLAFHSSYFDSKSNENQMIEIPPNMEYKILERGLQIAHGVRLQLGLFYDIFEVIEAAGKFGLKNVVHYCERQLIHVEFKPLTLSFLFAFYFELDCYLTHLMKNLKSSEELKGMLKDVRIEEMSGEAMKKCAKFFFKNSK